MTLLGELPHGLWTREVVGVSLTRKSDGEADDDEYPHERQSGRADGECVARADALWHNLPEDHDQRSRTDGTHHTRRDALEQHSCQQGAGDKLQGWRESCEVSEGAAGDKLRADVRVAK